MSNRVTPEDLYRFRWIGHVRVNPREPLVAYQVSWCDHEAREQRSRIWVRGLSPNDEPAERTSSDSRDHSAEWSPDGRRLAFVSRCQGRDQIFVLDLSDAEPRQLTSLPAGVGQPRWCPDGSAIAFLARTLSDPGSVVDDPRPREKADDPDRPPVARLVRRLDYRHDGGGYVDGRHHHLFVIPLAGGEARQLTNDAWSVTGFDWSPDGRRLAVAGHPGPDADLAIDSQLHVVELDGGRRRLVAEMALGSPSWSPRGDLIAFSAPTGSDGGRHERVWVVSPEGGEPRCLTDHIDVGVGDTVVSDMRGGHDTRLQWDPGGELIHFLSGSAGRTSLLAVDLNKFVRPLLDGLRQVYDFDVIRRSTWVGDPGVRDGEVAFVAADPMQPGDLHLFRDGLEVRLTSLNSWLEDRYLAMPERIESIAPNGHLLEGWLMTPPDFDPGRRYPLVLQIHGGPHAQYGWTFFHEFQILAGMGFLVFYLNPRGSDGYGEEFQRAVVRDWGGGDYLDLMAALDQLIDRGFVDTGRLGVGGGSYGGYMTLWTIGHTDRFAAAVAMRSISNLVSEYAQHDIVPWGKIELGPEPWPDPDQLWERSPIRYVKDIHTPLLLTHGEMDLRCAISQAEEMFGALRLLRRRVEFARFPGESHDLSRSGRPDRRVERLRRIVAWFGEHLLECGAADSAVVQPAIAD